MSVEVRNSILTWWTADRNRHQRSPAMCFKNLPIEFDASGRAQLRQGVADPSPVPSAGPKGFARRRDGPGARLAAPPRLRDWNIDPMTRVAGALAVHTVLDLENRRAVDAHPRAMLFRGYE